MLAATFDRQSSAADWEETIQLLDDEDNTPLWSTVPVDLVLTLTIIEDVGPKRSEPTASITAVSTGATGRITAAVNGFVLLMVEAADLADLAPDANGVDKRYLVFVKAEIEDIPQQVLVGVLPIYLGH